MHIIYAFHYQFMPGHTSCIPLFRLFVTVALNVFHMWFSPLPLAGSYAASIYFRNPLPTTGFLCMLKFLNRGDVVYPGMCGAQHSDLHSVVMEAI